MIFWALLIIFLILIIVALSKKGKIDNNSSYVNNTYIQRIEDCVLIEDIQYQISSETQRVIMLASGRNRHSEAERNRQFRSERKNQCTSFSFL